MFAKMQPLSSCGEDMITVSSMMTTTTTTTTTTGLTMAGRAMRAASAQGNG
jgi:hypothetical protein